MRNADPLLPMLMDDTFLESMWTHQWNQALSMSQQLEPLYSNGPIVGQWNPMLYERLGRYEEALVAFEKLRAVPAFFTSIGTGLSGHNGEAVRSGGDSGRREG